MHSEGACGTFVVQQVLLNDENHLLNDEIGLLVVQQILRL